MPRWVVKRQTNGGGNHVGDQIQAQEKGDLAERFATFAAGCLGASSPAKTASKLGIMGNVSETELQEILCHLEVLSKQRAAALAGQPPSTPQISVSSSFQEAVKEACGVDANELHLHLPKDFAGNVDLLGIFRINGGEVKHSSAPGCEALADFVDDPSELPRCETFELRAEADEGSWQQDTVAINKMRSVIFRGELREVDLLALAQRCRSRRPALCKTALRALAEAAQKGVRGAWLSSGTDIVAACLAAIQLTKVTAKTGEETLDALCSRFQEEAAAGALEVLAKLGPEVKHPTCVGALLRAMAKSLGSTQGGLPAQVIDATAAFCEELLKNRRFSPAFSEARAVLFQLAEHKANDTRESREPQVLKFEPEPRSERPT